ncbi:hypothetical protein VitviT2T_014305 [Vitis vinifera]|uniref:Protein kinase domain-containing protein n=1 Tax=Vitis vinifera TaxID=29760 RepID=A0ABY9CNG2_VITVI|nr:hypothetical protein VitviT2T_014305 [Vitis vinifera]
MQETFEKVYKVISRNSSHLLAVKSSVSSRSSWFLIREEEILLSLGACPDVVHCFGGYSSKEVDGSLVYNLILEYALGGSLRSLMERCRSKLTKFEVLRYARMIVRALCHMHERGVFHYVQDVLRTVECFKVVVTSF